MLDLQQTSKSSLLLPDVLQAEKQWEFLNSWKMKNLKHMDLKSNIFKYVSGTYKGPQKFINIYSNVLYRGNIFSITNLDAYLYFR